MSQSMKLNFVVYQICIKALISIQIYLTFLGCLHMDNW